MLVPDLIFDLLLFGSLLLASVLDALFPVLDGALLLLAVGGATYIAAQELSDSLTRAKFWTQESLATSLALSTGGFIYYWWRNQSDLALLCLSIGLMMASLMIAISVIAGCGAVVKEKSAKPLMGLLLTTSGSIVLGILAGLLTLNASLSITLVTIVSLALWKLREKVRPPAQNTLSTQVAEAPPTPTPSLSGVAIQHRAAERPAQTAAAMAGANMRSVLVPQRGTLLDRFLPVLVLGALLGLALRGAGPSLQFPASMAAASGTAGTQQK